MFYLINSDIFKIGILIKMVLSFYSLGAYCKRRKRIESYKLRIISEMEESQLRQEISIFFLQFKKGSKL